MLNALSRFIPEEERIVTIEDTAELQLQQRHVVKFETRPPNLNKEGGINQRQLLRTALRMRPDRIIVGEVRGDEAMDMLHAMTSGHDGSLTTIHASGPRAALNRLEAMATMNDPNLAPRVVRQMEGTGVDLIVHLSSYRRGGDRVRRVASVAFVDENIEDPEGRPGVFEFCRYRVLQDDWEIDDRWGLHPPRKVEEKLLMAGLHLADLRVRAPSP